jgi:L,D-peptidoglycan transpeptidase YkuD (ErfK/YbiS/YcfS/YnhG family)
MNLRLHCCLLLSAALLAACAGAPPQAPQAQMLEDAGQLVLVLTPDWNSDHGKLRRFDRSGEGWQAVGGEVAVTVGRAGSAWGLGLHPAQAQGPQKLEGDGRSPAGVFAIGAAFGYPDKVETGLKYEAMDADDWCVDVPGSPLYNRIVDAREVGAEAVQGSSEPMRRDLHANGDQRYRIGFVIEHNAAGADHGGSCIFGHVWKSPADATSGCTAMSDEDMQALLRWLDRKRTPRFVLLTEAEFARLRAEWRLPQG